MKTNIATIDDSVNLADPFSDSDESRDLLFAQLRTEQGPHWHRRPPHAQRGFWVLSRHEQVVALTKDRSHWSSANGNMLNTLLNDGDRAGGRMLVVSDPPFHTGLRTILKPAFARESLIGLQSVIDQRTDKLVERFVSTRSGDFASGVANRLPLAAIGDFLGIPQPDRAWLFEQTRFALASSDDDPHSIIAKVAQTQILAYFEETAAAAAIRDSHALSNLVTKEVSGRPLTQEEVVLNCYSLILGGDETTRLSMIGAVKALADNPQEWDRLKSGRIAVTDATEELLRWTSVVQHVGRLALENVRIGNVLIRKGDVATGWIPSANFDSDAFADPNTLDLARKPNRHLTFSYGIHFCLGAMIARIELEALLTALVRHVDRIELSGTPIPIHSNFVRGYSTLPVVFAPVARTVLRGGSKI